MTIFVKEISATNTL